MTFNYHNDFHEAKNGLNCYQVSFPTHNHSSKRWLTPISTYFKPRYLSVIDPKFLLKSRITKKSQIHATYTPTIRKKIPIRYILLATILSLFLLTSTIEMPLSRVIPITASNTTFDKYTGPGHTGDVRHNYQSSPLPEHVHYNLFKQFSNFGQNNENKLQELLLLLIPVDQCNRSSIKNLKYPTKIGNVSHSRKNITVRRKITRREIKSTGHGESYENEDNLQAAALLLSHRLKQYFGLLPHQTTTTPISQNSKTTDLPTMSLSTSKPIQNSISKGREDVLTTINTLTTKRIQDHPYFLTLPLKNHPPYHTFGQSNVINSEESNLDLSLDTNKNIDLDIDYNEDDYNYYDYDEEANIIDSDNEHLSKPQPKVKSRDAETSQRKKNTLQKLNVQNVPIIPANKMEIPKTNSISNGAEVLSYAKLYALLFPNNNNINNPADPKVILTEPNKVHRRIRLYKFHNRNGFVLQIGPDGTVNGTLDQSCDYTLFHVTNMGSHGVIQMYGTKAKRYICMDQTGQLHSTIDGNAKPLCTFIKSRYGQHYFTLISAVPHRMPSATNNMDAYKNNINNTKLLHFHVAIDKGGRGMLGHLAHTFSKSAQFFASYH